MATYNIIGKRFLRQYTAANTTPVYSAATDAQKVVDSLCDVPWSESSVRQAENPPHGSEDNRTNREKFDAALFCVDHSNSMHLACANAAVYRFVLPSAAVGKSLTSLAVKITSDPYNANGARVHLYTSSTGEIPTNCHTCRGEDSSGTVLEDGTTAAEVAKRTTATVSEKTYWYPKTETATLTPTATVTLQQYLFVFVSLEDYSTTRGNWLEGSSFADNSFALTTSEAVSGWTDGATIDLAESSTHTFNVCQGGVLPVLASTVSGLQTITLQKNGDEIGNPTVLGGGSSDNAFKSLDSVLASLDGPVTSVDIQQPSAVNGAAVQFAVITGKFSQGTFTGLPGFLIYDVWRGQLLENIALTGFDSNLVSAAQSGTLRGGFTYSYSTDSSTFNTNVRVFALFNSGALVYSSILVPFASFLINQNTGTISSPHAFTEAVYSSSTDCHFMVQVNGTSGYGYNYVEGLAISNGKLVPVTVDGKTSIFPSSGVAFAGTINAIRPLCYGGGYRFLVSGNLTSVGGVACQNCAIVTFTSSSASATVTVPTFDSSITPDTYEGFSVSAQLGRITSNASGTAYMEWGADGIYVVSGAFNALNGNTALKKAVDISSSGALTQIAALADESKVLGAHRIYGGTLLCATGSSSSSGSSVYNLSDLHLTVSYAQSCIGLRTLYAKLFNKALYAVPTDTIGSKERVGAGFAVNTGSVTVNALSGTTYSETTVPVWQLSLASLVVPFSLPQDFTATQLKLDWSQLTATAGKLNVWLKRDTYVSEMPAITDPSFFLADQSTVDGWEFVGSIDHDDTTATFSIAKLNGRLASLLFTAYVSLDDLNPSSSQTMPQGVCTAMSVDSIEGTVSGLTGNWKPDITLIG